MSLTRERKIAIAGYVFTGIFLYLFLVIADYGVAFYLGRLDTKSRQDMEQARAIEKQREEQEDKALIADAKAKGLKSLYYPELFSVTAKWNNLAKEYGIAPLAPPPHTDIYYCNEGYGQVRYRSDRYGFRNEDALWDAKSTDVAIVGDSFIQGACVGNDQTIAARLNQTGVPTINLGTGGNSPIHYASVVKIFTRVVRPRNVIIVFYPNDNVANEQSDIYNEIFFDKNLDYFDWSKKDATGHPALTGNLLALHAAAGKLADSSQVSAPAGQKPDSSRGAILKASIIAHENPGEGGSSHARLHYLRKLIAPFFKSKELPYGSRVAIETVAKECELNKCRAIIAYIPNSKFWRPDARAESYAAQLKDAANKNGLQFLDFTQSLQGLGMKAYAVKGPHLSPEGYAAVAGQIREVVQAPAK